jgi:hypothetical protein
MVLAATFSIFLVVDEITGTFGLHAIFRVPTLLTIGTYQVFSLAAMSVADKAGQKIVLIISFMVPMGVFLVGYSS